MSVPQGDEEPDWEAVDQVLLLDEESREQLFRSCSDPADMAAHVRAMTEEEGEEYEEEDEEEEEEYC